MSSFMCFKTNNPALKQRRGAVLSGHLTTGEDELLLRSCDSDIVREKINPQFKAIFFNLKNFPLFSKTSVHSAC